RRRAPAANGSSPPPAGTPGRCSDSPRPGQAASRTTRVGPRLPGCRAVRPRSRPFSILRPVAARRRQVADPTWEVPPADRSLSEGRSSCSSEPLDSIVLEVDVVTVGVVIEQDRVELSPDSRSVAAVQIPVRKALGLFVGAAAGMELVVEGA